MKTILIIKFLIVSFFLLSCENATNEIPNLTKAEVKELIDVGVKHYLDTHYNKYNVYNQVIRLIDTSLTAEYIHRFEDTSNNVMYLYENKPRVFRRIPFLDSIYWKSFNISKLDLTDTIQYELHDRNKTLGISYPYYTNGYYLVQFKKIIKKSNQVGCGMGMSSYGALFYQKKNGNWVLKFDIYK